MIFFKGAYDGIMGSNTLRLELSEQWSGLLVEPNPKLYKTVQSRSRNAWTLGNCFSMKTHPQLVTFDAADQIGGIVNEATGTKPGEGLSRDTVNVREEIQLQCVPIFSVLQALDNPQVDFFSLDIEGADLQVLKTIPFDKVRILVIFIIQTLIHPALYSKEINMFCEIGYGPMNLSPGGIRFSPFSLHSILQS